MHNKIFMVGQNVTNRRRESIANPITCRAGIPTWRRLGRAPETVTGIQMAAFCRKPLRGNGRGAWLAL